MTYKEHCPTCYENINQPSPDAVEALENAILSATDGYTRDKAKYVAQHLLESGFTIAPVGVAKQPEERCSPALTRSAPMSEAELEREAESIANYYIDDGAHPLTSVSNRFNAGLEIINLAKKYRGES